MNKFNQEARKALSMAHEKLMLKLIERQTELRRCEQSIGKGHNVQRINRLRKEIESLEKRLDTCESLIEKS